MLAAGAVPDLAPVQAGRLAAAAWPGSPAAAGPGGRRIAAWYAGFAGFAVLVLAVSGQPVQRSWAGWAAGGYALAWLTAACWRSRGRQAALVIALAAGLAAPLAWQVTFGRRMPKAGESPLEVVARAAALLLRHGTPYLPSAQISHVLAYNPYEPAMAVFGLPGALGLHGAAGSPRLWLGLTAGAALAAAFQLARPGSALRCTAFALGSPAMALPLVTGQTDPPVLALLCLTLAGASAGRTRRGALLAAGLALGAACAMKAIAWPALPVIAAMLAARHGSRVAARFAGTAAGTAAALIAATAPASVARPAALLQNTVLFPLGLARYQTLAASPLPGHLLAATGPAGRWAAISLLAAAGLAIALSLVLRPPLSLQATARRLALGLGLMFMLAPASRWGYFVYPAALLGFAAMVSQRPGAGPAPASGGSGAPAVRPAQAGSLPGSGARSRAAGPGAAVPAWLAAAAPASAASQACQPGGSPG